MGHYDRPDQLQHEQIFALEHAMRDGPPPVAEFDLLTVATFCLDGKAAITWANAAAAALLAQADGLSHFAAGLAAAGPEASVELNRLIRRCVAGSGGALRLQRPSGAPPLAVIAIPCRRQPGHAWLFIGDPQDVADANVRNRQMSRLTALYRLTAAEAAIALQIAAGSGLPAIAAALDLSPSTVRTHTKHMFSKMQVHNQIQLARLVFYAGMFDA